MRLRMSEAARAVQHHRRVLTGLDGEDEMATRPQRGVHGGERRGQVAEVVQHVAGDGQVELRRQYFEESNNFGLVHFVVTLACARLLQHLGRQVHTHQRAFERHQGWRAQAGAAAEINDVKEGAGAAPHPPRHSRDNEARRAVFELPGQVRIEARCIAVKQLTHIGLWCGHARRRLALLAECGQREVYFLIVTTGGARQVQRDDRVVTPRQLDQQVDALEMRRQVLRIDLKSTLEAGQRRRELRHLVQRQATLRVGMGGRTTEFDRALVGAHGGQGLLQRHQGIAAVVVRARLRRVGLSGALKPRQRLRIVAALGVQHALQQQRHVALRGGVECALAQRLRGGVIAGTEGVEHRLDAEIKRLGLAHLQRPDRSDRPDRPNRRAPRPESAAVRSPS